MHCIIFLNCFVNESASVFQCFTYLAHRLKKLLNKCNILCKQLWHATAEDTNV